MLFSSLPFVCLFLPMVVAFYFALPKSANNTVLVVASVIFYAWDDPLALIPIGTSIVANFQVGKHLRTPDGGRRRHLIGAAITGNLILLIVYKYTAFIFENVNDLLALVTSWRLPNAKLPLPLGISFFTFHMISYLVDVYRGAVPAQRSLPTFALYMLNFPQMIAGPIIRYRWIADQLTDRKAGVDDLDAGISRFVVGLAKKLLIADPIGSVADQVFALAGGNLAAGLAWTGVVAYTLQIYFDFSGYSDMAIGLARIFGFRFPENFNYPYAATSIQDFWHRWHMTLSSWFRDYVYIPLGGNRFGDWTTTRNLWIVFLLAGVWHGASWTFVVWGMWHGLFLSLERAAIVRAALAAAGPLRHLYAVVTVMIGWVFFRAETLGDALTLIRSMFGFGGAGANDLPVASLVSWPMAVLIAAAGIMSLPAWPLLQAAWPKRVAPRLAAGFSSAALADVARAVFVAGVTVMALASMALTQQNPFIYFRF
jgi:alginate O-acetyltransferase complex protein AlgI